MARIDPDAEPILVVSLYQGEEADATLWHAWPHLDPDRLAFAVEALRSVAAQLEAGEWEHQSMGPQRDQTAGPVGVSTDASERNPWADLLAEDRELGARLQGAREEGDAPIRWVQDRQGHWHRSADAEGSRGACGVAVPPGSAFYRAGAGAPHSQCSECLMQLPYR